MKAKTQSYSKAKKAAEKQAKLQSVDKKKYTSKEFKGLSETEKKPMSMKKVTMTRGKSGRGKSKKGY